jgi:hypothetical protein
VFSRKQENEDEQDLNLAITECISGLRGMGDGTEEYVRAATALKTLIEARAIEIDKIDKSSWMPSADTVVTVAGSLLGVISILTFEKWNVITTKALTFAIKPKV